MPGVDGGGVKNEMRLFIHNPHLYLHTISSTIYLHKYIIIQELPKSVLLVDFLYWLQKADAELEKQMPNL